MATLKKWAFYGPKGTTTFVSRHRKRLANVNALVIHQTGATIAQYTFNSYQNGGHGAHFLIDKMGKIYQTANLNKKAHHVGKIKSKYYETKACTKAQLQAAIQILFKKGQKYSTSVTNLHNSEKIKPYPDRYPLNTDSIGIEIVGNYDTKTSRCDGLLESFSHYFLSPKQIFTDIQKSHIRCQQKRVQQYGKGFYNLFLFNIFGCM